MNAEDIIKFIYMKKDFISLKDLSFQFKIPEKEMKEIMEVGVGDGLFYEVLENQWDIKTVLEMFYENSLEYGESKLKIHLNKFQSFLDRFFKNINEDGERNIKNELKRTFIELTTGKDKKWAMATELIVEYLKKKLKIYTTKDDNKSEIWIYNEGIYIPQGRSEIKEILRDLLQDWYSIYIVNLVTAKIEADTFIDSDIFFKNNYKEDIPLKNGVLNILSRELKPFSSEKIFFNKLPIEYDLNAKCPQIEKFLTEVLPYSEDKNIFYEIGGFCLMNEYTFEKAFMFVGDGRNGKDKSLELLKRVLGVENCVSLPISTLTTDSFVIGELFNKKANLAGEISNQDLKDTTTLKALTGRSLFSAKRKFLPNITFVNYAKFVFACNELPMVYDISKGFWDRWVLIEFTHTFVTQEEFNKAKDKTNLKIRDEDIINKITTPNELNGLLIKFLDGLDKLLDKRNFSSARGSEEIKNIWIRKSNSFTAFCMDFIEQDYDKKISKKELRRKYIDYCKKHKVRPKSDFVIKRVLQDEFGTSEGQEFIGMGDMRDRFWEGIRWK